MGILIVFMGNITPKIFNQWVFAVFTCVFYSYTHAIWSPVFSTTLVRCWEIIHSINRSCLQCTWIPCVCQVLLLHTSLRCYNFLCEDLKKIKICAVLSDHGKPDNHCMSVVTVTALSCPDLSSNRIQFVFHQNKLYAWYIIQLPLKIRRYLTYAEHQVSHGEIRYCNFELWLWKGVSATKWQIHPFIGTSLQDL